MDSALSPISKTEGRLSLTRLEQFLKLLSPNFLHTEEAVYSVKAQGNETNVPSLLRIKA